MNVGDSILVRFHDIAPRGDAVSSGEETEGKPVFASGVLPGETARVRLRRDRKTWWAVDVEEIVEPSPDRVRPRCPLFDTCSGCQLQHVAYPRQLELKREMVAIQLEKFGGLTGVDVRPPLGAANPWNYRNHARFTVRDGRLGYIRRFRRQWFEVPYCHIMDASINDVLGRLQGQLGKVTQCNVRSGRESGQIAVQPKMPHVEELVPTGQDHLFEVLHGHRFKISAASFFQVNRDQAEVLADVVADRVALGEAAVVVDAYAGVGTFAVLLAKRVAKVIAIEESGPAVRDAQENIAGIANIEYRLGKTEDVLGTLEGTIDAVILDPPRSGCHAGALEAVRKLRPLRVVYVSCDPASLGRDLAELTRSGEGDPGFELLDVQPVDMFPHTHHIECVATLQPRSTG